MKAFATKNGAARTLALRFEDLDLISKVLRTQISSLVGVLF